MESNENLHEFGFNTNGSDKGSPLASVSAFYDVLNDILIDVSLNSHRYNERESAKNILIFYQNLQIVSSCLTEDIKQKTYSIFAFKKSAISYAFAKNFLKGNFTINGCNFYLSCK